ncbi:predicted protein [Arabidopsis lyrata subsp. lyrata]|uniref:Predicted protein n=1 Tax=Arabidopsis lyrata subsp. lyrata TaxID=81972 RepID=D7M734_ARALL|nr:predicted protein [Arabidopsis lyrata subsp. lyrata]
MYVLDPATRWYRRLPEARFQALYCDTTNRVSEPLLGFGKDNIKGIYKLVWLYNSDCVDLDGQTNTCEVFSFNNNKETQVLSFDLHTETFKVMANIPVGDAPHERIAMCTLNDRLCLSEDKGDTQTIWSLNQANMTWHKTYSVQLSLVLKRNILTHGHRSHPFSTTGYCFMIAATTSPRWWYTIID